MPRTLLIGNSKASWREWLKAHRGSADIVCLEPAETLFGTPGRLSLVRGDKPARWRFFGSLDAQRYPHVLLATACELLSRAGEDAIILCPPFVPSPVQRHTFALLAEFSAPAEILIAKGTPISHTGWPVGPEEVELPAEFPDVVQHAQRKAQWLEMLEGCSEHQLLLGDISLEGARLGSGVPVSKSLLDKAGGEAQYAEVCGNSLLVVAAKPIEENHLVRLLDVTHTTKAFMVEPTAYENLLCSFAHESGEDFGMGIVRSIDFSTGVLSVLCTAIPPAPVRLLRLGSLRLDEKGREQGETKPWSV